MIIVKCYILNKMNLKFLSLPVDLIDIIWDYASEDYKIEFEKTLHFIRFGIPAQPGNILRSELLDKSVSDFERNPDMHFYNHMEKYLDFSKSNDYLNILTKCNCCKLHSQKKPLSIDNWNDTPTYMDFLQNNTIQISKYFRCQCPCRHFSRNICRATVY